MKKDEEPIKFEIFQSDMEKIMYFLDHAERQLGPYVLFSDDKGNTTTIKYVAGAIKRDLQHKIMIHKERGEWV